MMPDGEDSKFLSAAEGWCLKGSSIFALPTQPDSPFGRRRFCSGAAAKQAEFTEKQRQWKARNRVLTSDAVVDYETESQ
jgi:hypothetical protein